MTSQQVVFLLIVAVTLVLFISERIRIDVAAMLTLLALAATGILTPVEALSGFASEPAIIVASVFVISAALTQTGLTERIGAAIARAAGAREWRAVLVVMPAVAALAAFSHHLMITAMMLPIMMRLARVQNLSPSRLLMPMSLAASLGTTLTIFSAPAFLLMNHLLLTGGQQTLGIFGITPIGIALVALAILYMSLNRWILPKKKASRSKARLSSGESPGGGPLPELSARVISSGRAEGRLVWMASSPGGAKAPICSVTIAPQSPPCATNCS